MTEEDPVCRICYDEQGDEPDKVFISPCCCTGEQLFVHKGCLNQWIKGDMQHETYFKCATCKCNYNRSKPDNHNDKIEKKTLMSILAIESGLFIILLFFILGCSRSSVICSLIIFLLYITSICYICGVLRYDNLFCFIVIIFVCLFYSNRKTKLFFTNLWLILFYALISFGLVTDVWDTFYRQIEKCTSKDFHSQMFDKRLGIYVDGII